MKYDKHIKRAKCLLNQENENVPEMLIFFCSSDLFTLCQISPGISGNMYIVYNNNDNNNNNNCNNNNDNNNKKCTSLRKDGKQIMLKRVG